MDKKALEAGINYHEFRYREADFGGYPKGLMYGLQIFDSWLYDETKPFIHVEALDTFAFLKEQINTGYFEKLIQTYLLDNQHGALVTIVPEPGRTARLDAELKEKLQVYKESLTGKNQKADCRYKAFTGVSGRTVKSGGFGEDTDADKSGYFPRDRTDL